MDNKNLFKYIKTPCGQSKYIELQSNKSLLGKLRLFWVCNYCFYKRLEYQRLISFDSLIYSLAYFAEK